MFVMRLTIDDKTLIICRLSSWRASLSRFVDSFSACSQSNEGTKQKIRFFFFSFSFRCYSSLELFTLYQFQIHRKTRFIFFYSFVYMLLRFTYVVCLVFMNMLGIGCCLRIVSFRHQMIHAFGWIGSIIFHSNQLNWHKVKGSVSTFY